MATSGGANFTSDNQYIVGRVQWDVVSSEPANNRSKVRIAARIWRTTTYAAGSSGAISGGAYSINGTTYSYSKSYNISTAGSWTSNYAELFTREVWISHNADGSKSFPYSFATVTGTQHKFNSASGTGVLNSLMQPPVAPTGATHTRNSDTSNTVNWTNNPTAAAPYAYIMVERSVDGGTFAQLIWGLAGTTNSFTDNTTTANHSYSYRISANNASLGNGYGTASNATTRTYNTPAAPATCSATNTGPGEITVSWTGTINTEASFVIERSNDDGVTWAVGGTAVANATSWIDLNVPTGSVNYRVKAINGSLQSAYSPFSNSITIPVGVSFTFAHQATANCLIVKAKYEVGYEQPTPWPAIVKIYRGAVSGTGGTQIFSGRVASGVDIPINLAVLGGEWITVVVTTSSPIDGGVWIGEVFEAIDNNTWTFLGYADDKLVGMTANEQLWNGDVGAHRLENAVLIETPAALPYTSLAAVGNVTIKQNPAPTDPEKFRITLCHTLLNQFGPTLPSTPLVFYASKPTSEWTTANFVKVTSSVPNMAGIVAVELYYTEAEYQEPAFLGRVSVPEVAGSPAPATKAWTFNWTGYDMDTSAWLISNLTVPEQNFTRGVPASRMSAIDGQLYFWGNTDMPYRIWIGGNPGNRFSVSPGVGGGFVDVEPGTGTSVSDVLKFKTQQGAAIVTALCDNQNSTREARYNLVESNIAVSNEQSVKGWMAEKVAGTAGCKSENGAVAAGDGLYAVSRYGLALTTLTMEYNSQLQIMYVSDAIEPVFLKQYGYQLEKSTLFEINGVLYMTFGTPDGSLDNVIFCYDISLKAWWTYTLDTDEPILNMIQIDYEREREGLGIITADGIYLLPTTMPGGADKVPDHEVLIETGELSTVLPLQAMHHLSQLEFRFDYFIGDLAIEVTMIDQFGRKITTTKTVSHDTLRHQLSEYVRIDQVVESYKIVLRGKAGFRMTHFIAKLYPKPARIGMVYGFDSSQSDGSSNMIRRTFNSYNDLRKAIIP